MLNTTTIMLVRSQFSFIWYRILKQRLEAANHERPLSLYQEALCGMTAGAIGTIFSYFRNLLLDLCHTVMDKGFLAMYKGGGPYTACAIGFYTGMFASYGRSVTYFKDSFGLSKSESQFGCTSRELEGLLV